MTGDESFAVPTGLLTALRALRKAGPDALMIAHHEHGLQPLDRGRNNNEVFTWTQGAGTFCISCTKSNDRQRVVRAARSMYVSTGRV